MNIQHVVIMCRLTLAEFELWSKKVMSMGEWQWLILAEACKPIPPTVMWQEDRRPSKLHAIADEKAETSMWACT